MTTGVSITFKVCCSSDFSEQWYLLSCNATGLSLNGFWKWNQHMAGL